ncbi:MAG TPA: hypothetical protein VEG60_12610 [Candidatus Binatia bacterium]|nr:hypothetical protein [Candidatus Binatia bacterium]
MNLEAENLRKKLFEFLNWERRKRREQALAALFCYALLAAVLALPFHGLLQTLISRWFMPILFVGLMAPFVLVRGRWRRSDSARALAQTDKALCLDERAVTAWELLERNETRAAALLVLKQAGEKLTTLDPRALFRRTWSWQAACAPVLLLLWLGLVWFDIGLRFDRNVELSAPRSLAQKLREFARELQQKASNQGLHESLRMGRELEQAAQKGIDAQTDDQKFKAELAGLQEKIATMEGPGAEQLLAGSEQDLQDLRAELDAARDLLNIPDAAKGMQGLGNSWRDRLGALPQLKKQMERQGPPGQSFGQNELKTFLDQLERRATGELDRRALLDAQRFLEQLRKEGQGEKGESDVRVAGPAGRNAPDDGEKAKSRGNLPGKEPGKKEAGEQPLPEFQPGPAAHVKGLLGEGEGSGLALKAKPSGGKSEVSQDEVIASYRRQAEAELNTEQVPEALKETIKNYFLSLGISETEK